MTSPLSTSLRCSVVVTALLLCGLTEAAEAPSASSSDAVDDLSQRVYALERAAATLFRSGEKDLAGVLQRRAEEMQNELLTLRRTSHTSALDPLLSEWHERDERQHRELMEIVLPLRQEVQALRGELTALREQVEQINLQEQDRRLGQADLTGLWEMTLPAGWKHRVKIFPQEHGLMRVETKAVNLAGAYHHQGSRLRMELPVEERMQGLVWRLKDENSLELVDGPDYVGATMVRLSRDPNATIDESIQE